MLSPYPKRGFLCKFETTFLTVEHRVHTTIGRGKRFLYAQLYFVLKSHVKCSKLTILPFLVAVLKVMPLEPKVNWVNVTVYSVPVAVFRLYLDERASR